MDEESADICLHCDVVIVPLLCYKKYILTFVVIYRCIYFVEGMLAGVNGALAPYVTSAFALHSLTPTVSIISTIIGGVMNLTLAKILDVFGRPQGYLFCICLAVIGLAMTAACNNVEAYAAAQVFYTVGNNGITYSLSVLIADTSSLRNRGLVLVSSLWVRTAREAHSDFAFPMLQAFSSSPSIITCWLAGPISSAFLSGAGWRWCFGVFTILVPAVTLPLLGLLIYNYRKAAKQGLIPKQNSQRSPWQSIVYYAKEFDAVGLLMLSGGVAMFLLPFNLYTMQGQGWQSPLIICLLVFGLVSIILFVIYERFLAPTTFIPYSLLLDRTVLGACFLSATLMISYYSWNVYFGSFLQVVYDLNVTEASYVQQTYTVVNVLCCLAVGFVIHRTGRYKPATLYVAVPISVLGSGLLIYFRRPNHIGYIVM
jgi:MFS family permease